MDEEVAATTDQNHGSAKRCSECGLEYFPHTRRGESDDRIDKLFGLDVVSALNSVMDLLHASHDRPNTSAGAFAAWNWLAGLRQMFGAEQASSREWAHQIAELRGKLLDFGKAASQQESLETMLVQHGGQSAVVRTRCAQQLAGELAGELAALEHLWKRPSRALRPSKHTLGTLELKLLQVGFSHREIAKANFDGALTDDSERSLGAAIERLKKRIKAAEKAAKAEPESGNASNGSAG